LALHRFYWTHEDFIGELPVEWNHLVGEYDRNDDAKIVHWTLGGPWFNEYSEVEYGFEWDEILADTLNCKQLIGEKTG